MYPLPLEDPRGVFLLGQKAPSAEPGEHKRGGSERRGSYRREVQSGCGHSSAPDLSFNLRAAEAPTSTNRSQQRSDEAVGDQADRKPAPKFENRPAM
jgi:hypothetical protein